MRHSSLGGAWEFLVSGIVRGRDERGRLILDRTGPFMPPITIPDPEIVVSNDFREQLSQALPELEFREVIKGKIVEVFWEEWDRNDLPAEAPIDGEPDAYIMLGQASPRAAEGLGRLWEVVLHEGARSRTEPALPFPHFSLVLDTATWDGSDVFLTTPHLLPMIVVTERARIAMTGLAHEWVSFKPVKTNW